jgi:hypothetical protein
MKRKGESLGVHCKPVVLHREDVLRLHEILADGDQRKVDVEADGYMFDDLHELLGKGGHQVDTLQLKTSSPYVSLKIESKSIWLYASSDDAESRGLYEQLREYLSGRRRRRWLTGTVATVIAWTAVALMLLNAAIDAATKVAETAFFVSLIVLIAVYWVWWIARITNRSLIYLTSGSDSPGFWQRNKDSVLVSLGTTVVGVVLGIVLERYVL